MTTTDATPTPIPIPAPSPTPTVSNPKSPNRYTYTLSDISYRRATLSDYDLLRRYRIECGWGLERMEKDLRDEGGKGDTPLWIFSVPSKNGASEGVASKNGASKSVASESVASKDMGENMKGQKGGEQEKEVLDVGMGGLVLHAEGQRYMADRESRTVKLSSLYITHAYQNLSLGSLCLTILENLAIEEYGAEWLTLDTTPYVIDDMSKENSNAKAGEEKEKEGKENGSGSGKEPGKERIGEESRNLGWYRRRGYEEFRERIPYYQQPGAIYHAAFLRRKVVRT
ncbi:hypothetical protein FFLO_06192 [Filobasidium floriforme]|uniref:N-acetyltransferase domain-containing protein n=1 Tax=Filobasidium floriforme TaxID=5210 RepID=A0A8K0NKS8_9TREE|nr:uncharacterized protein HD553DRAFT_308490 [Filobasidium floriforme]KAG7528401.1 hypothetical protein FFLO_06192 [Filobasidium floriforme]KAH8086795.1 hypothetical protein HD553DRAFT_308490 [Filobasidium floriforme]